MTFGKWIVVITIASVLALAIVAVFDLHGLAPAAVGFGSGAVCMGVALRAGFLD